MQLNADWNGNCHVNIPGFELNELTKKWLGIRLLGLAKTLLGNDLLDTENE